VEKNNANANARILAAESYSAAGNPVPQARDPILRPRDLMPLTPAGAESHFAEVMKFLV